MKHVSKTSIYTAVEEAFKYSVLMGHASLVTGTPGIGKSTAARHLATTHPATSYVRIDGTKSSTKTALSFIGEQLGFDVYDLTAAGIWDLLEGQFNDPASRDEPLVIDEAQNMPLNILKELVDLPERFGKPVIVCGNSELLKPRRSTSAAFAQIESRIAKHVILTKPTEGDFQTIAIDFDVLGKDAHDACVNYGSNTSIRDLVAMLELARIHAGDGPLRIHEIRSAVAMKKGGANSLKLLSRVA
jgi:DNA transposition AAA+ family ATPase